MEELMKNISKTVSKHSSNTFEIVYLPNVNKRYLELLLNRTNPIEAYKMLDLLKKQDFIKENTLELSVAIPTVEQIKFGNSGVLYTAIIIELCDELVEMDFPEKHMVDDVFITR